MTTEKSLAAAWLVAVCTAASCVAVYLLCEVPDARPVVLCFAGLAAIPLTIVSVLVLCSR